MLIFSANLLTAQQESTAAAQLATLIIDYAKYSPEELEAHLYQISYSAKLLNESETEVQCLIFLSRTFYRKERYLDYAETTMKLDSIRISNPCITQLQKSTILNNSGQLAKMKGDYRKAIKLLFEALELEDGSGGKTQELGILYNNISNNYRTLGDFTNALEVSVKVQQLYNNKSHTDSYDLALVSFLESLSLKDLGEHHACIEKLAVAQKHIESVSTSNKNTKLSIQIHLEFAEVNILLNQLQEAIKYLRKAKMQQEKEPFRTYQTAELWALCHIEKGEFNTAESKFKEALHGAKKVFKSSKEYNTIARIHRELGDLYLSQGKHQLASSQFLAGLENFADRTINKDNLYYEINELEIADEVANLLRGLYLSRDDPSTRSTMINATITYLDRMKSSYLNEGSKFFIADKATLVYNDAIDLFYENREDDSSTSMDDIYLAMEKNKAGVLLENVRHKFKLVTSTMPADLIEKELAHKTDISYYSKLLSQEKAVSNEESTTYKKLQNTLFEAKEQYAIFNSKIQTQYPEYSSFENSLQARPKLTDLQYEMADDQLVIEYMATPTYLYRLEITKSSAEVSRSSIAGVDSLVGVYRDLISSRPTSQVDVQTLQEASQQLASVLLPVSTLVGYHSLTLIPDGQLGSIPFEAMIVNGKYLVEHLPVHYAYSASQMMDQNLTTLTQKSKILCIAPKFDGKVAHTRGSQTFTLPALPYAESEAEYISSTFKSTIISTEKTEPKDLLDRLADYQVLHLATHAEVNTTDPMLSEVYFNKGSLTAYDIRDFNVQPKLVVLSACNTAAGKLQNGEGMLGLSRSFLQAGVRCLQSSLWSINDQSSNQIVTKMYEHLAEGASSAQALQKAKLHYLNKADKRRSHPYYWAGIIQIGEDLPILIESRSFSWVSLVLLFLLAMAVCYLLTRKVKKKS